jgi:ADP-ribose pyrophosphatase
MPFTTLDREKKYSAHVFDVAKIHVRLPDGRERYYDLVEHNDSVTILPIDNQGNIYFVTQHRVGSGGDLLELPAGVMDKDEAPSTSAKRELREEIGVDAHRIMSLGGFYLAAGYTNEYMHVFLASDLFDSPLDADEDEFLNISKIPVKEVYQKAYQDFFQDGKTLAALLLARPYIDNPRS